MPDSLTGAQLESLFDVILEAFDVRELNRLVRAKLDVDLERVTEPGSFEHVTWQTIAWVCRQGMLDLFLQAISQARPGNHRVGQVIVQVRADVPTTSTGTGREAHWHYLHKYRKTGHVLRELITLKLAEAFGESIPRAQRTAAIDRANAVRRMADPDCGSGCFLSHEEIPPWDVTPGQEYWFAVLQLAKLKSPRTLAALLCTVNTSPFTPEALQDLNTLLQHLH